MQQSTFGSFLGQQRPLQETTFEVPKPVACDGILSCRCRWILQKCAPKATPPRRKERSFQRKIGRAGCVEVRAERERERETRRETFRSSRGFARAKTTSDSVVRRLGREGRVRGGSSRWHITFDMSHWHSPGVHLNRLFTCLPNRRKSRGSFAW